MQRLYRVPFAVIGTYLAGFTSSVFMRGDWQNWFEPLLKPSFTPPIALFELAWFVLYLMMGLAAGLVWYKTGWWHPWIGNYTVSLAFIAAWSMFFFELHVTLIALVDSLCLGLIMIAVVMGAWEIDRRAGYLLLAPLAWILFTIYLNAGVWALN